MVFRNPKWWAFMQFAIAFAMLIALYVGAQPQWWGWLMFLPLFFAIVYEGARSYSYSLSIEDDRIKVDGFKRAEYSLSEITAVNVWFAKGGRIAVVNFGERRKLSFTGRLVGFDKLVEILKSKVSSDLPT